MSRTIIKRCMYIWSNIIRVSNEPSLKYIQVRFYSKENKLGKEEVLDHPSYMYQSTSEDYNVGRKYAIRKLQQLFNIGQYAANNIATKYKILYKTMGKTMMDNYNILKKQDVPDEIILKYADVLAQKQIDEKILLLKTLPYAISETVPLLNLEVNRLTTFIERQVKESNSVDGGRLGLFSTLLDMPIIEICDVLTKRTFLQTNELDKLKNNYKLLTDFGIKNEEICRDFWVLRYNTTMISYRLNVAKQLNLDKIKTWMVRAQPEIFDNYIQRRSDNKLILGDNSLAEYLSEQLDCTIQQSKVILSKHPALSSKSMKKLKTIIDFLLADGFTPHHILRNPKILLHSVETTKRRLQELKAQGMVVESLHILTKSQKQYMKYYDGLTKSNKTKIKDKVASYLLVLFLNDPFV